MKWELAVDDRRLGPPPGAGPGDIETGTSRSGTDDEVRDETRATIETILAGGARGEAAFSRLVSTYRDRVVSVVSGMLGDPDQAEDIAQEVFLKVHANLHQFRFESRFDSWLYRISYRTAVDHTRRFWTRRRVGLESMPEPKREAALAPAVAGRNPEATLLDAERAGMVRRALEQVPEAFRAAVVLKDMAELSYEEIGDVLGCPLGTVESRIHRGRAILRKKLERVLRA